MPFSCTRRFVRPRQIFICTCWPTRSLRSLTNEPCWQTLSACLQHGTLTASVFSNFCTPCQQQKCFQSSRNSTSTVLIADGRVHWDLPSYSVMRIFPSWQQHDANDSCAC